MSKSTLYLKDANKEALRKGSSSSKIRTIGIYYRCSDGRFRHLTKQRVRECDWIEAKIKKERGSEIVEIVQRVNPKVSGGTEINYILDELQARVDKVIRDTESAGRVPTVAQLEFAVQGKEINPSVSLFKFFKEYSDVVSSGAEGNYEKALSHLTAFNNAKAYNLDWHKLTKLFYKQFIDFLSKEYINPQTGEPGILNSTISRTLSRLKTVCRQARKQGIEVCSDVFDFRGLPFESKNYFIDEEDLINKLEALDIDNISEELLMWSMSHENNYKVKKTAKVKNKLGEYLIYKMRLNLKKVRDCYVFSFDTALRYGDGLKLIEDHIVYDKDADGNYIKVIDFGQQKVKSGKVIPLSNRCLAILGRWKGKQFRALPYPKCDVTYNRYLKRLFKLAGFTKKVTITRWSGSREIVQSFEEWEILTSHTGRHSAATNMLDKTGDLILVRDYLGHKSVKTTERYAKNIRKKFHTKILNVTNRESKLKAS